MKVFRQNEFINGNIDLLNTYQISGWAIDRNQPDKKIAVELYYEKHLVCRVVANQYRKDLEAVGTGDGQYAFKGFFNDKLAQEQLIKLTLYMMHEDCTREYSVKMNAANWNDELDEIGIKHSKKYGVAIVAILKNELHYILEWIAYHRIVGVEHFFLYDNNSTDGTREVLQYLAESGIITLVQWPDRPGVISQNTAYDHAVSHFKEQAKWLAIIDGDEMIVPLRANSILEELNEYEEEVGVAINWKVFGSSGQVDKTSGLVMERFTKCSDCTDINRQVKTIARADKIACPGTHCSSFVSGYLVDENKEKVYSPVHNRISYNKFQINHYFTKSKEEWNRKRLRGKADFIEGSEGKYRRDSEFEQHDFNEVEDNNILRFLHKTKKEMLFLNRLIQECAFRKIEKRKLKSIYKRNINDSMNYVSILPIEENKIEVVNKGRNGGCEIFIKGLVESKRRRIVSKKFFEATKGIVYKQSFKFFIEDKHINPKFFGFGYYGYDTGYTPVDVSWISLGDSWWYGELYYYCFQDDKICLMDMVIPENVCLQEGMKICNLELESYAYVVSGCL